MLLMVILRMWMRVEEHSTIIICSRFPRPLFLNTKGQQLTLGKVAPKGAEIALWQLPSVTRHGSIFPFWCHAIGRHPRFEKSQLFRRVVEGMSNIRISRARSTPLNDKALCPTDLGHCMLCIVLHGSKLKVFAVGLSSSHHQANFTL